MTFKGGSMVEVCRRNEGPFGSWYRARIISVDGQRYKVQYENILDVDRNSVVEEVYSEATRPVPPSMKGLGNWVAGDTIEVYDHHSWKIGKIVKVLAGNFFIVKLLESRRERTCHQSNLRPRLSWQDGKWLRAQQAARNHYVRLEASQERASFAAFSQESHAGLQLQDLDGEIGAGNRKNGLTKTDSYLCKPLTSHVSLKATKRKPGIQMQSAYKEDFFNMEAAPQKRRAIQKSRNHKAVGESSRPLLEKVEASTNKGVDQHMPLYNLPSKILCRVIKVQFRVEPEEDEVFAHITLFPKADIRPYFNFWNAILLMCKIY